MLHLQYEMERFRARKTTQAAAVFGGIASLILLIYAAQPWSSYAYGNIFDYTYLSNYIYLSIFSIWLVSPYVFFYYITGRSAPDRFVDLARVGASIAVFSIGVAMIVNRLFISPDPQGGLIFLVLPAYQWPIIAATELANHFVKNK